MKNKKIRKKSQKTISIEDLDSINYIGKTYPHEPSKNLRNLKLAIAATIDSMFDGEYSSIKSTIKFYHKLLGAKLLSATTEKIIKGAIDKLVSKYTYVIQWSDEDNVYIASVYELKGCMTHGKTMNLALKMAQEAAQG